MDNNLGLNSNKLTDVERKIINLKLHLLDYSFTFNCNNFNIEFLKRLNGFLFNDFYSDNDLRPLDEKIINKINKMLDDIIYICINDKNNIKKIIELVKEIWNFQPFLVGNTRTLIAYLKILNECFELDLNINLNMEITNNPDIFDTFNPVNQKGLTR